MNKVQLPKHAIIKSINVANLGRVHIVAQMAGEMGDHGHIVLGQIQKTGEWATWMFDSRHNHLFSGSYFMDNYDAAVEHFRSRI